MRANEGVGSLPTPTRKFATSVRECEIRFGSRVGRQGHIVHGIWVSQDWAPVEGMEDEGEYTAEEQTSGMSRGKGFKEQESAADQNW